MGNSQTKESRASPSSSGGRVSTSAGTAGRGEPQQSPTDVPPRPPYATRPRRSSRPDLSFLGIGGSSDQDATSLEGRRETKQEREARKLEKERVARLKERERSMREEHVDGGYLVTQGVYVGIEDYNKVIVRQLMIERRLAPFWKGLNDFSESWAEHQLMAAARGLPIPPADEVPPELEYRLARRATPDVPAANDKSTKTLTIPIGSRSQSYQSDASSHLSPAYGSFPLHSPSSQTMSTSPLFRTRAKTLASLTTSPRSGSPAEMVPRELQLPADPFVNGQPIEAYLYKDASECPICFLYYPPYLNTTRCCDQAICSECFVQIKRPDPHQPEHEQPDANAPSQADAERQDQEEGLLVSEVATCPYCKQPEFGITYVPPSFRRGLSYGSGSHPYQIKSAVSSQTSLSSGGMSPGSGRRRGTSLSANAPEVITTDKIRPDWATKLATARAHAARRSAAATALHTAAYLMNGQPDARGFGPFGRRVRRPTLEGLDSSMNPHLSALAMLAERHAVRQQEIASGENRGNPFLPPPRGSSSRRNRMDDLEDMMMMEAIRLSLASEEDRRKKEDKEAKKEAKKKEKESKKAEKAARKNSLFTLNSNTSNPENTTGMVDGAESASSSIAATDDASPTIKGKAVDRADVSSSSGPGHHEEAAPRPPSIPGTSLFSTSQESLASSSYPPLASEPFRRSHLRQMSNVSSSASSFVDSAGNQTFPGSSTPPGGGAGLEPMFNFRSLAAMIGEEEKPGESSHVEDAEGRGRARSFEELDDKVGSDHSTSSPESANGSHKLGEEHIKETLKQNGDVKGVVAAVSNLTPGSSTPTV